MIDHYLACRHEFGGRGPTAFDCWGLVRDVRARVFGWAWLPSYGAIRENDKRGLTSACWAERERFIAGPAAPGAIATCWRGLLCVHVGVAVELDGRLGVLDTNPETGPRWQSIRAFEQQHMQVIYYHDD
ncbi:MULTISPECIES: C40 family peptidase [unclassified Halomonas]|uniref:C40 family peptidase n=1 Tax=unclassified Halomonas TaxID=2609666 RepID=UPI002076B3B0|nr:MULTISPECIES: C40 family peptidase [unclassified Halomonas]